MSKDNNKRTPFVPSFDHKKVLAKYTESKDPFIEQQEQTEVQIKATDYTFLNPDNIFQAPELIALMYEATGKQPIDLVSFRPERVLFQVVAASISALVRYKSEEERNKIILQQVQEMKPLIKKLQTNFNDIKIECKGVNAGTLENKTLNEYLQKAKEQVTSLRNNHKFPCDYYKISENELIIEIASCLHYKEKIYPELKQLVKLEIKKSDKLEKKQFPNSHKDRVIFFLSGGVASGKGTSQVILIKEANSIGIKLQDLVLINSDSYKSILIKPTKENAYILSQITHPEARIIVRNMAQDIADEAKAHMLIDQIHPMPRDFDYAKNGSIVRGVFVSTKVEDALARSFTRGEQTLRHEDTINLLKTHKEIIDFLPEKIRNQALSSTHLPIKISFVDNNVPYGTPPNHFMDINLQTKEVKIIDNKMLKEFLKKHYINEKAKRYDEIYTVSDSELKEKLKERKKQFVEEFEKMNLKVEGTKKNRLKNK